LPARGYPELYGWRVYVKKVEMRKPEANRIPHPFPGL